MDTEPSGSLKAFFEPARKYAALLLSGFTIRIVKDAIIDLQAKERRSQ